MRLYNFPYGAAIFTAQVAKLLADQYLMPFEQAKSDNHVEATDIDAFITIHQIDVVDLRSDNFKDYFPKQAKTLLDLISKAMGKPIFNLGGEEVVAAFGVLLE